MPTPTGTQNKASTPTAAVKIMPAAKSAPTATTPTAMQEIVIEGPNVASKARHVAMQIEEFVQEHIGMIMLAFGALLGLVLVVLFTKKGQAIASAVKG